MSAVIGVSVTSSIKHVRASFTALTDKVSGKATMRALNRALDQSATEASRKIREVYNILEARLEMRGERIGVIEFGARQVGAGVSVKIKRAGGRDVIPHAFITTLKSGALAGYRGVAVREGKGRFPIRFLRSISLPQAFKNKAVLEAVNEMGRVSFVKNLRQQIVFLSGGD